jgi:hypothetical protein
MTQEAKDAKAFRSLGGFAVKGVYNIYTYKHFNIFFWARERVPGAADRDQNQGKSLPGQDYRIDRIRFLWPILIIAMHAGDMRLKYDF